VTYPDGKKNDLIVMGDLPRERRKKEKKMMVSL
jgi:hypothetical protein